MKNYIVSSVRPIRDGWHLEKNRDLYKNYQIMYEMSLASQKKFCLDPFEPILLTDPQDNTDKYTEACWYSIKELWHREPCNIFWLGADTMMLRPTNLFDPKWTEFRLFNYTDPRSYKQFKHYFNDDVKYFPHTMSKEVWDLGQELWKDRDTAEDREWGFDQNRHNAMFWSQSIPDTDRLHPYMNFMAHNLRSLDPAVIRHNEIWNSNCKFDQANIIHFAASRGSQAVIDVMRQLCKKLDIQL